MARTSLDHRRLGGLLGELDRRGGVVHDEPIEGVFLKGLSVGDVDRLMDAISGVVVARDKQDGAGARDYEERFLAAALACVRPCVMYETKQYAVERG